MSDDNEREGGPLPPHERAWRHPAELGEWTRNRDAIAAAPPPLSRRLTAVIAVTSIVASGAIAVISVPRSDRDGSDATAVPAAPSIRASVTTVTAAPDSPSVAGPTPVPAVRVGDYFVAMLEQVDDAVLPDGAVFVPSDGDAWPGALRTAVLARDASTGIAVLSVVSLFAAELAGSGADGDGGDPVVVGAGDSLADLDGGAADSLATGTPVVLVAADGTTTEAVVGLSARARPGVHPLEVPGKPSGACLVRDATGNAVGVAVHHRHATWLVTYERVAAIIDGARAATN